MVARYLRSPPQPLSDIEPVRGLPVRLAPLEHPELQKHRADRPQMLHPFLKAVVDVCCHAMAFSPHPPVLDVGCVDRVAAWLRIDLSRNSYASLLCRLQARILDHESD